jgi:hypothetical protein
MANTQQLAALLNEYVRQMGIDPRLVTIASSITPWDPIYVLSGAELKSLNLDNSSAAISGASANWSVQPAGNGAIATATQAQDGAGRMASLGIMCIQSRPNTVIVRLAVQDDNVDWTSAISSSGLSPQSFNFEIDGTYGELKSDRLISPIERMGNGVLFDLAITQDELGRIMSAKSVRIAAFVNMASQRWTGPLGGTFSMMGAPAAISLALKNCLN